MNEIIVSFAAGIIVASLLSIAADIKQIKYLIDDWGEEDDQL